MSIEVGSKLQGKVTGITNFGAFVELPDGSTGLVHISEVADNYVKDINDHLKVGDQVEVKVINVEKDGKIGLSIKKAVDRPEASKPQSYSPRPPRQGGPRPGGPRQGRANDQRVNSRGENFESKMARFLKDSEDRLSSLKRNTESKRGGRGARRG
ncbi:RNA-binding protein S1 [Bacillus canaveralius]|uniref:RNA-binding protein S1 n=1 Tax=Bacillus canaveralius TaxID=1403243 RepID=A0A2N5GHJ7_9BACI|nr:MULTISPECIES: S1 domain-containing RNA-binding protein [Bacillus]PLR80244.1 RNA-binding protein S1 [Bacillus canaveralius]PLR83217.1 RNA-binding protein S1 [Bacillus sp. V33-4]PLS00469.1 RNA-binding protein S1 [Bacillus canaveralius]RSK56876.1 RNA-binding protein S1 [Bacillus canaveralius]